MLDPAFTGSGASAIVIARSACVETVVLAVDVFGVAGSLVVEVTVAVLLIDEPFGVADDTVVVIVTVDVALAASVARVHVTVPVAPTAGVVHTQPAAVIDWKRTAAGRASVNVSDCASLGPLLPMTIVYGRFSPANAVGGAVFEIVTSASVVIATVALAVRGRAGSVVESMLMLFWMLVGGVAAAARTPSVNVVTPTGIAEIVQVTVPFAPTAGVMHDHPGALMLLNRSEAGSTSVNVRSPADDGP